MIFKRKISIGSDGSIGFLLFCFFLIAERGCFISAQADYMGITASVLQEFYKRQTTANPGTEKDTKSQIRTNFVSNNDTANTGETNNNGSNTYVTASPPVTTQFPLAVPIAVGETERQDKLHQATNKTQKDNSQRNIDYEKAQLWRYKLIKGTDAHLKDVFIGKCWDYQNRFKLEMPIACERLWEAFLTGFAYKLPCDVTLEDYQGFFGMIHEGPLVNKSLLWSGSRYIAHELSSFNTRFTALEDTFAGYLLDGTQWCGMPQYPGVNYRQCPYECAKQKAFWGAAAKKMAERSEGIVYAVLNGTRQHWKDKQIFSAYMMDSYMARNQIPNLNPHKVKEVRIMVGHSLHQKVLERCGTFSVKELQKQIKMRGIKATCIDDPLSIRALLCLDYPKDALCQFHLTALLSE